MGGSKARAQFFACPYLFFCNRCGRSIVRKIVALLAGLSVFGGGCAYPLFKLTREQRLILVARPQSHLLDGIILKLQIDLGLLKAGVEDHFGGGILTVFLKDQPNVGGGNVQMLCNIRRGDLSSEVLVDKLQRFFVV